jgi:G3E family GTPase
LKNSTKNIVDSGRREALVSIVKPEPSSVDARRLPVTVICGFVGAGKSTLVQKVVAGWRSGPLAVLLHDRSDAGLNRDLCRSNGVEVFRLGEVLAELVQRCVGCSLRESLTSAITAIAEMGRFERLLIECSGLVEPFMVAEMFNDAWDNREPLVSVARLDHLITVVDSRTFWEDLHSDDDLQTRGVSYGTDDDRTISELLVEQVEYATAVIMAQTAGMLRGKRLRVRHLLQSLNPEAVLVSMDEGPEGIAQVVRGREPASMPISFQPGWVKLIQGAQVPIIQSSHWTMGAFEATRPFHPQRLWELIESDWPGILRCRGHFWIASQPDRCFSWEQTAGARHFECIGDWWVATPRDQWPTDDKFQTQLKEHWSVEFGDRRQVFGWIGYRLDVTSWRRQLQRCLLTQSEVLEGEPAWRRFEDPFARAKSHAEAHDDDQDSD